MLNDVISVFISLIEMMLLQSNANTTFASVCQVEMLGNETISGLLFLEHAIN